MVSCGYRIETFHKGLIWNSNGTVFTEYIDLFYKMKEDAEREGNPVMRSIAKLFLNSLYSKTLQKAMTDKTVITTDIWQYNDFDIGYDIKDIKVLQDDKLLLVATVKTKNMKQSIKKPLQLGSFVLAYSRTIMMNVLKAIDPTLKKAVMSYTDTDSAHISGKDYKKLLDMGYIRSKKQSALGYMCSNINGEGIIIRENNLGPKCYEYQYIDNGDNLYINKKDTIRDEVIMNGNVKDTIEKYLKKGVYNKYSFNTISEQEAIDTFMNKIRGHGINNMQTAKCKGIS